ncbi:MAG: type 4a pilus biogenesis protein PilO [Candidatus Omnitrophica bacterium]|nr:type 4a pilus biogenesis protein PilO [Candidatus Omnitrophota bacterium]
MDMKPLLLKNKNKVINLAVLILSAYIALVIYQGQNTKVVNLANAKEMEIKKNEVLTEISQQQAIFNNYRSFVNAKDASQLSDAISNIAAAANAKIVSFRPMAEENFPVYSRFPFDIRVETNDYHSLGKFISSLESHQFLFDVESIKITAQPPEKGKVRLTSDLKISSILIRE